MMRSRFALCLLVVFSVLACAMNNRTDAKGNPLIIPQPQKITYQKGVVSLPEKFTVTAPEGLKLSLLQKTLAQKKLTMQASPKGFCVFTLRAAKKAKGKMSLKDIEGYTLDINAKGIQVSAFTEKGLWNGLQTVRWIIRNSDEKGVKFCRISDYPDMPLRAIYLECNYTAPIKLDKLEHAFEVFAEFKYNTLVVDFGDKFPLNGKPLPNAVSPFSVEDIRHFQKIAAANGLEIIPCVQCVSHAWWMIRHPDFKTKFRECEVANTWSSSYCVSSPEAKKLAMDYVNSHLELLKPRYFHLALDEVFQCGFNLCDRCRKGNALKSFEEHMKELNETVVAHNAIPMIFDDNFRGKSATPCMETLRVFDKRTVINIWDYAANPAEDGDLSFREHGFTNYFYMSYHANLENVMTLPQLAARKHSLGCVLAWWNWISPTLEYAPGRVANVFASVPLSATYCWNAGQPHFKTLDYDPVQQFRVVFEPEKVACVQKMKTTPVSMASVVNAGLGKTIQFPKFTAKELAAIQKELASTPEQFNLLCNKDTYYALVLSGNKYDSFCKQNVTLKIDSCAKGLSFLMMGAPWNDLYNAKNIKEGCTMTIAYADGSKENIAFRKDHNLVMWNGLSSAYYAPTACQGVDKEDSRFILGAFCWKNEKPAVKIASVTFNYNPKATIATAVLAVSAFDADSLKAEPVSADALAKVTITRQDSKPTKMGSFLKLGDTFPKEYDTTTSGVGVNGQTSTFKVINDNSKKYIEIKVPAMPVGAPRRVVIDVPFKYVPFKTFVMDRQFSDPKGVKRSDFYFIQQLPGEKAMRANAYLRYDDNVKMTTERILVPFSAAEPKEIDHGGVDFTKGNIKIRISFWVVNKAPMTIRIFDAGYTDEELPFVTKIAK